MVEIEQVKPEVAIPPKDAPNTVTQTVESVQPSVEPQTKPQAPLSQITNNQILKEKDTGIVSKTEKERMPKTEEPRPENPVTDNTYSMDLTPLKEQTQNPEIKPGKREVPREMLEKDPLLKYFMRTKAEPHLYFKFST